MARWRNQDLIVYHGTDDRALVSVLTGIKLGICRPNTDFGQGFYTTTSLHQAKQWANGRAKRSRRSGHFADAVVVPFALGRNDLANMDVLVFTRATVDFWMFVSDCRSGVLPHQRLATAGITGSTSAVYEVVFGPVTLWPQRLTISDCDQISFHMPKVLNRLTASVTIVPNSHDGLF